MSFPAVLLHDVSFIYENAHHGLHDINLQVEQGSCHVLMGGSGSGKTTIIRLINGLAGGYYPGEISGDISIMGNDAAQLAPWQRATLVGSVFQDPATQFFSAQLAGEVAFGCENLGLSTSEVQSSTDAAIARMNLEALRNQNIDTFSSGEKQRVAIAGAIAPAPKVLVMDEPSANLDEGAAQKLGNILQELKSQGYTLIIAEHRIAYILDIADVFHYVQDGTIVKDMTRSDILDLPDDTRRAMGIRTPYFRKRKAFEQSGVSHDNCITGLCVRNLEIVLHKKKILSGITMTLQPCSIVAITGKNGAGKTTLMRALSGLIKPKRGEITFDDKPLTRRRARSLVWYSPNDVSASFFTASVAEEVMLHVEPSEENISQARTLLKDLGLYEYKDMHPYALSGGQSSVLQLRWRLCSKDEF